MNKKRSDATQLLREEVQRVLATATAPLTSLQIAEEPGVASLGLGSSRVAMEMTAIYMVKNKPYPLKRIPCSHGRLKWEYFNPRVVKLAPTTLPVADRRAPEQPPVNAVNSNEFTFDPVAFDPPVEAESTVEPPEQAVTLPNGVKSITLTIGGVMVKIELGA